MSLTGVHEFAVIDGRTNFRLVSRYLWSTGARRLTGFLVSDRNKKSQGGFANPNNVQEIRPILRISEIFYFNISQQVFGTRQDRII